MEACHFNTLLTILSIQCFIVVFPPAQEEELYEVLNRARLVVQTGQSSAQRFEAMAHNAQRQKQGKLVKIEDEKGDQSLIFTDTSEFCRTIELADEDKGKDGVATKSIGLAAPAEELMVKIEESPAKGTKSPLMDAVYTPWPTKMLQPVYMLKCSSQ